MYQHDKDLNAKESKIKGLRRFDNALSTAANNSEKED